MYKPRPIDTGGLQLPDEFLPLIEKLAEHTHDIWAAGRISEGWVLGEVRSDPRKENPNLIPYSELTEAEKRYDRDTAVGVVRALMALGFEIAAPAGRASGASGEPVELAISRQRAEQLLRTGHPLLAYDTAEEGLGRWEGDLRLRQLKALALARSGAQDRSNELLSELERDGHIDAETLGLLAGTHKSLALLEEDSRRARERLETALRYYERAYQLARAREDVSDAFYTGINAASVRLMCGLKEPAAELAAEVAKLCRAELERNPEAADYWLYATLGEAALLLGERDAAESSYATAVELASGRFADISSTRHQARLLCKHLGQGAEWIERVLQVPPVAVFASQALTDGSPGAAVLPELERRLAREIRDRLERVQPLAGYGSAANPADLLFLEALREIGAEVHVLLPFPPEAVREIWAEQGDDAWTRRFDAALEHASSVRFASDHRAAGSRSSSVYANKIKAGIAQLRAQRLGTELVALAVWDGRSGQTPDGVARIVEAWRERGHAVEQIDVPGLPAHDLVASPSEPAGAPARFRHEIRSMLFADAVGFSRLSEDQIPRFIDHFLGEIARLLEETKHGPVHRETDGDGLYFVFGTAEDAGHFALELCDRLRDIDWSERGLPETLGARIALHCGPVHLATDPITGRAKYTGPHTSQAARIEPITPAGYVYASQAFAAVATSSGIRSFQFDYVGTTELAKKYGARPLYHVHRMRSSH